MKNFVFIFAIVFFLFLGKAYSQSAVAFCTKTGAYGYAYNYPTKFQAEQVALKTCHSYGGTNCVIIVSTSADGYGAIAIENKENGKRIIGAAVGYKNLEEAKERAIQEAIKYGATNPHIVDTWYDR